MANFDIALKATIGNEGGYSNLSLSVDPGGETYKGVSRVAHPSWVGWKTIDAYKKTGKIARYTIFKNPQLDAMVYEFYKSFWQRVRGAEIESQQLANFLFDSSVNHGNPLTSFINKGIVDTVGVIPVSANTLSNAALAQLNTNGNKIYPVLKQRRWSYYQTLGNFAKNKKGWWDRIKKFPETLSDFGEKKNIRKAVGDLFDNFSFFFLGS